MANIAIYTSNNCRYCYQAKQFLMENHIDFIEFNISENLELKKDLIKKGHCSVPIIQVGDKAIIGFDEEELRSILQL